LFNNDDIYQTNKFLLKQIEDLRQDVEELHAFIKDAFGKDSSSAASKGDTGATGPQGPKGDTGATGATGPAGADGKNGSDASVSGFKGQRTVGKETWTFEAGLLKSVK
jgi:hypothetical protein